MRAVRLISAVTILGTATTLVATSFAESPSPQQSVFDATAAAERAANVEGALQTLEIDAEAKREGSSVAKSLVAAARGFRPITLPMSPNAWQAAGLDLAKAKREGDQLVQVLADGTKITFTIDPDVQSHLERMLDEYNVPHSGVVLVEPETGRVRALVSHTEHDTPIPDLAQKSTAPSASVFKVITAAALIESGKIDPDKEVCYHGGRSHLTKTNIVGSKRYDKKCAKIDAALAWSINSIFAKLAYKHLERDDMQVWAERFGYNQPIPFELPVEISTAEFVSDPLERARTAAGFWHTYLSPLHGALIGATLANDGVMMQPSIIESVEDPHGDTVARFKPTVLRRVMSAETAQKLAVFMEKTTESGTARKYFRRNGFPSDITVSGKTGTLSNKDPYLGFTWFVGFARHEVTNQKIGVSGLVCNTPIWRIKGGFAASEAVRKYFDERTVKAELAGAH